MEGKGSLLPDDQIQLHEGNDVPKESLALKGKEMDKEALISYEERYRKNNEQEVLKRIHVENM